MTLGIIHPCSSAEHPEARFIEPWAERKVRRAGEVKALALAARTGRMERYWARIDEERRAAQEKAEHETQRLQKIEAEELARKKKRARRAVLRHTTEICRKATKAMSDAPSNRIIREVASAHGLRVADIKGESRVQRIARARHEACYRLVAETSLTYQQIGRLLGGRVHSTIWDAVRKHAERHDLPPDPLRNAEVGA